jgi:hypothetical protein
LPGRKLYRFGFINANGEAIFRDKRRVKTAVATVQKKLIGQADAQGSKINKPGRLEGCEI